MDSVLNAAARALAAGDALRALNHVALLDQPPALALRGIALAQLGDHERARRLLRQAGRAFGPRAPMSRARCLVAEAEVCLATRELAAFPRGLQKALTELSARGDHRNALHGGLVGVRYAILLGRLDQALSLLSGLELDEAPPALRAIAALCSAEIDLRRVRARSALAALSGASEWASRAAIPALRAEVQQAHDLAERPAARLVEHGRARLLTLLEVEKLFGEGALIVDACRRCLRHGSMALSLAKRPVLFALLACLGADARGASRETLIAAAFGARRINESHRARLRVEIGRLRRLIAPWCAIAATPEGFRLIPKSKAPVQLLLPPVEGETAALQALMADGLPWSTSALGLALGQSQRNVQRSLAQLEAEGKVRALGRGRSQRWLASPLTGFTTALLLPLNVAGS